MKPATYEIVENAVVIPPIVDRSGKSNRRSGVFSSELTFLNNSLTIALGKPRHLPAEAPDEPPRTTIKGTHVFGGLWQGHFGHILTETTGRLWVLDRSDINTKSVIYIPSYSRPDEKVADRQFGFLRSIGIDIDPMLIDKPVTVERLIVPTQQFGLGPYLISGSKTYRDFIKRCTKDIIPSGGPLLYISRTKIPADRGTYLGEELLEGWLKEEGYEIYHPQVHSVSDQLSRLKGARRVISSDASPLHLMAYVANPSQQVAIIQRRSTRDIVTISRQLIAMGASVDAIEAIIADHVPSGRPTPDNRSWGEIRWSAVGADLKNAGYIEDSSNWSDLPAGAVDAKLSELSKRSGLNYRREVKIQPQAESMVTSAKNKMIDRVSD